MSNITCNVLTTDIPKSALVFEIPSCQHNYGCFFQLHGEKLTLYIFSVHLARTDKYANFKCKNLLK